MNLMFSDSRVVAGRRLWHPLMADPVRRTSEKLVRPYLPRPLTSPSSPLPWPWELLWITRGNEKSFTMQRRGTPVPAQPRVKRALLRCHRGTVAVRGWAARPRSRSCVWWGRREPGRASERVGGTRRYEYRPGTFLGRDVAEARR